MNEDAERVTVERDLQALARAWRDAEEIAGIADDLLPGGIRRALVRLRSAAQRADIEEIRERGGDGGDGG